MSMWMRTVLVACVSLGFVSSVHSQALTLEQVIREVCANSDSVKMMKETMYKSDQLVKQKKSAAMPIVSGSVLLGGKRGIGLGDHPKEKPPVPAAFGDTMADEFVSWGAFDTLSKYQARQAARMSEVGNSPVYSASLQVQQTLTFGKIGTAVKVAKEYDQAVHATYDRSVQQLQLAALDAFYGVVLSEMSLSVAERSLARKSELHGFLDRNFQLGSGSKALILATGADVVLQSSQILQARQAVRTTKMMLASLMGRPLTDQIDPDTAASLTGLRSLAIPSETDAVNTALTSRGDLKSLGYYEKANRGGAKIFRAMYYPTIGAQASGGFAGTHFADVNTQNYKDYVNWTLGVGMNWQFFDGFNNSSMSHQYLSDARKLEQLQKTVSKMVEIEVTSLVVGCAVADSSLAASEQALAASRESYDLLNENFKQGSGQFADLQLGEERLRQAEMGLVNARYGQMRSRAALLVAMGQDIVKLEAQ